MVLLASVEQKKRAVKVDRPASAKSFVLVSWIGAGGASGAAHLDLVFYFLSAGIFLRDAESFLAVRRAIGRSVQFDVALGIRAHGYPRKARVGLQGRLNLAGRVAVGSHVTLRHTRSRRGSRLSAG